MLNPQYLFGDHNYGIQFYQKPKKASQSFSFLKIKSKKNFVLLTISWIFSRSKKLTRSNPNIMDVFVLFCLVFIKVVGYKVQITFYKLQPYFYFFISITMKYQKLKQGKNTRCNSAPRTIFCVDGGISKEKGTAKSYFTLYFFQYRFAFSTFYFGKLVFCLSVFNGFSVFS